MKPTPATQQSAPINPPSRPAREAGVATHIAPAVAPGLPLATVAGCRLLEEVAVGGHAVVYRAQHERLGRPVAIKALRADAMAEPGLAARFLREARILGRFAHPNLPQVYDVVEERGALFIVLEWCAGIDLQDALTLARQIPWPAAIAITAQTARALSHVHARGVLHGDIKPANLILTRRGLLKLVDFGVARVPSEDRGAPSPILGTPGYRPPGQPLGSSEPPDARDDQFALGVVLHQMLYGRKPGEPALSTGPSGAAPIPPSLQSLLGRCLEALPGRRFEELSSLIDDCLQALRLHGSSDEQEPVRSLVALLGQPAA